jgi:hypothetical protein
VKRAGGGGVDGDALLLRERLELRQLALVGLGVAPQGRGWRSRGVSDWLHDGWLQIGYRLVTDWLHNGCHQLVFLGFSVLGFRV